MAKAKQPKAHHAKPFRKRHLSLLGVSILSTIFLAYILTSSSLTNYRAVKSARDLISGTLGLKSADSSPTNSRVNSSYGFTLEYDTALLAVSGLDSSSNKLYIGSELATPRQYSAIKISPNSTSSPTEFAASGSLTVEYHTDTKVGDSADLAKLEAQLVGAKNPNFSITKSSTSQISGQPFLKSEWVSSKSGSENSGVVSTDLQPRLTSYTGVVNDIPLTIVVSSGLAQSEDLEKAFTDVIASLKFQNPTQPLSSILKVRAEPTQGGESSSLSLLDRLMMTEQASAATAAPPSSAEKTSMLYGPAVVKIYNTYCMDIMLGGEPFVLNSCGGGTGSGFFVGNQGYIATNGHVAANNPLDIAIIYAFEQASKGNPAYFSALAEASGLTQAELDAGTTNQEQLRISVEKFYQIPKTALTATNKTENIIIGLGEKQPDVQKLLDTTKAGQIYPEEETLKQSKLVDYDYRAVDGADTGIFKASDVALLKIEGTNYPSAKLGSISSLTQGSGLSIIGYPAAASLNQLVEATESRATLTSGKVSSIKSATGSSSQLIETDATIGHGNSGGPAFNDGGEVVGIATYTIDGSGDGNGVFNYVRDIADLNALAAKNSVKVDSVSEVQQKWQKGVDYFYQAHHTKALKEFSAVKALYPQHPRVGQLAAAAQQKIDAGEEAKDFPFAITVTAVSFSIALIILSVFLIIHHHKKHKAYQQQLGQQSIATPPPAAPQSPSSPLTPGPNPPPATPTL